MWPVSEVMLGVLALLILMGFLSGPPRHRSGGQSATENRRLGKTSANLIGATGISDAAANTQTGSAAAQTEFRKQGIPGEQGKEMAKR